MKFGPDALLGVLFVFVGYFAVTRYLQGDLVTAGIGFAAWLAIAVMFLVVVIKRG